ncbi:hypothetical protein [Serratia quinivorans]|uniref:hypothetical protein n=1 Tax=Serratia quinivorans TaxID=137545 RepID=UPI0034E4C78C
MSISNSRQISNILILGAGELGMAMLKGFVREKERRPDVELTVLLRPLSLGNTSQENLLRQRQLEAWGINIVTADFSLQSEQELATVFAKYDAVINCSGFVGGKGTQLKITRAESVTCAAGDKLGHRIDRNVHQLSFRPRLWGG